MKDQRPYTYKFYHPSVAADCVIFGYDAPEKGDSKDDEYKESAGLKTLLVRRAEEPYKDRYALPGGFVNSPGKSVEDAAKERLIQETGLSNVELRLLGVYSKPDRDLRNDYDGEDPHSSYNVISVAYTALVKVSGLGQGDSTVINPNWIPVSELLSETPSEELAFDHADIIREALKDLRDRICFEPVGFELLPESFTMKQLLDLYTAILGPKSEILGYGKTIDRSNFYNKMRNLEILEPVDTTKRPWKYIFNKYKYEAYKNEKGRFKLEF